jgi:hypothetical protein
MTKKAEVIERLLAEQDVANFKATLNRARSINIGTCFGGVTEISMRGSDGCFLWAPVEQVEVVELIFQMAASIGCIVQLQPRDDFSSWRNWRNATVAGVKDSNLHFLQVRSDSNEQTVATQKTIGRKRTKRAAAAA